MPTKKNRKGSLMYKRSQRPGGARAKKAAKKK